jgi:hypothetical protein
LSVCAAGAEIRIAMDEGSSLLRPMSKRRTSNDALFFTTVSNTTFRICESIRWPSASTTSLNVVVSGVSRTSFAMSPRFCGDLGIVDPRWMISDRSRDCTNRRSPVRRSAKETRS